MRSRPRRSPPGGAPRRVSGGVRDAVVPEAVDELDVELARLAAHEPASPGRTKTAAGAPLGSAIECRPRLRNRRVHVSRRVDLRADRRRRDGREDLEPRVVGRDEDDEHPVGAVLGRERDRGLVPVVTVGDQELARPKNASTPASSDAPESGPVDVDVGRRPAARASGDPS